MTWTLVNSIADPSGGAGTVAAHNAMVYLLDTFLPAHGWTVAAHPDGSAFKRKLNFTHALNTATGAPLTQYYWVTWNSVTAPTGLYIYTDETYTSVPGDLCTFGSRAAGMFWSSGSYIGVNNAWRFWQSTDNANATLVTRGKKVWWWWPGWSSVFEPPTNLTWAPTGGLNRGIALPLVNNETSMRKYGYPVGVKGDNNTYHLMVGMTEGAYPSPVNQPDGFLVTGVQFGQNSSVNYLNTAWTPYAQMQGTDVLYYIGASSTGTNRQYTDTGGVTGQLILSGSKYYLTTRSVTSKNVAALFFDMGTSEPDLS